MCEKTGPRNHACRIGRAMYDNTHQAGWFITMKTGEDGRVSYAEPLATASGKAFRTAVEGRANYVRSAHDRGSMGALQCVPGGGLTAAERPAGSRCG
jgi:hypothetical protein